MGVCVGGINWRASALKSEGECVDCGLMGVWVGSVNWRASVLKAEGGSVDCG